MRSGISLLLFVMAGLVVAFALLSVQSSVPQERIFRIAASQYSDSPSEFHINPGDTVTLELVSTDVVHGLYVDGYGVSVQADPGQTAMLTFTADRPGSFRFRCNVTCGAMHPFMIGKLTIGINYWLYRGIGFALLAVLGVFVWTKQKRDALWQRSNLPAIIFSRIFSSTGIRNWLFLWSCWWDISLPSSQV